MDNERSSSSIERKAQCLDLARAACCGDRALNYGSPEDNFARIAQLWEAYMGMRASAKDHHITPTDVAIMSITIVLTALFQIGFYIFLERRFNASYKHVCDGMEIFIRKVKHMDHFMHDCQLKGILLKE